VTANELPSLEDTGQVPHYLPGENPEEDYMVRTFNVPKDAAMGHAYTLYPEYRQTIRSTFRRPSAARARLGTAAAGSNGKVSPAEPPT
jgi:hypothetical protein